MHKNDEWRSAKKRVSPSRTVKCDQHFIYFKWFSHLHAPYYPASIKQYWNIGEEKVTHNSSIWWGEFRQKKTINYG